MDDDEYDPTVYRSADDDGRHPSQAFCSCGSAWFEATIALEHDGTVNAYTGPLTCIECHAVMPLGWRGAMTLDGSWFDPGTEDD